MFQFRVLSATAHEPFVRSFVSGCVCVCVMSVAQELVIKSKLLHIKFDVSRYEYKYIYLRQLSVRKHNSLVNFDTEINPQLMILANEVSTLVVAVCSKHK